MPFEDEELLAGAYVPQLDCSFTAPGRQPLPGGTPFTPSPVLHDNKLYFVTDSGMLSCLDAGAGAAYYKRQPLPAQPELALLHPGSRAITARRLLMAIARRAVQKITKRERSKP